MAYSKVSTRTTTDPNASADINQLQDNFDSFLNSTGAVTSLPFQNTGSDLAYNATADELQFGGASIGGGGLSGVSWLIRGDAYVGNTIAQSLITGDATPSKVILYSDVAPSGTLGIDVLKNGTSILNATLELSAGTNTVSTTSLTGASLSEFDRLSLNVVTADTTATAGGSDLMVAVAF